MKKIALMMFLALSTASVSMAQQSDNQRQRPTKEQMIQHRTDRTAEELGLNSQQAAQLLELNKAYADKMPMMGGPRGGRGMGPGGGRPDGQRPEGNDGERKRPSKEEMEARMKEMKATMDAYNGELQKILTADQYAKYQEQQKERMQRRGPGGQGGRRGQRGGEQQNS